MKSTLCIDAGASSSKWALFVPPSSIRIGRSAHITGHIFDDVEWDRTKSAIEVIARETGHVDHLIFGVTGLDQGTEIAKKLALYCFERFKPETVEILNDMELAHSSFYNPGEGIILYAGTGAIAATRSSDGELQRVGGRGYMIADEGGGFWIGREALRHITGIWDRGSSLDESTLAAVISNNCGLTNWNLVRDYVYSGGRQAVANLAPQVAIAESLGCEVAHSIFMRAANELTKLFKLINSRFPTDKCVALGGVFSLSETILKGIRSETLLNLHHFEGDIPSQWIRNHEIR